MMRKKQSSFYAADLWEEHCVECGAPACYKTCEIYLKAPGGSCRRFRKGIEYVSCRGVNAAFAVDFLPWGKLEMYWRGRMTTSRMSYIIRRISLLVEPILSQIISDRIFRTISRKLTSLVGKKGVRPTKWLLECQAEHPTELLLGIADVNNQEILVRRLELTAGENSFAVTLPKISPPSYFRLSSINGTDGRIVFKMCDIVYEPSAAEKFNTSPASFVKCVAWDLDNTLWDGILADVGLSGVKVRENVIQTIKQLDGRGILNTICSKNDYELAWKALESFGISEYFVFPRINWCPKSENLKCIAKDINIGIDTFAFIDDSFHERGEVSENLPCVRVFNETDVEKILTIPCFNPPFSSESANRRLSYLAEMGRRRDETAYDGNHEDFLRKCNITLSCFKIADDKTLKRCWELVNRTNQLTLAAHRYEESEFRRIAEQDGAYAIRCIDKYGDYGIVGFVAFKQEKDVVRVLEFVMSCRVAKKLCEQSVLVHFAAKFRDENFSNLVAEVVETGRNGALVSAFDAMPFTRCSRSGHISYELNLRESGWQNVFTHNVEDR